MNRKEWKELCKVDKVKGYYWYNKTREKLLSKEFESDPRTDKEAKAIHHLRDTEEQRKYNDEHYELFGFEIDGNGKEHFEYGKYVVFWTKEHHNEYHHCSEETRKKRSESLKKVQHTAEWHRKIGDSIRGRKCSDEQRKQISESVSNLWKSEDYRERHSKATKEAMQRPYVRQHLLDGCKKRPPISKEARKKAGEANKAKYISDDDICEFVKYFNEVICVSKSLGIKELSRIFSLYKENHKISWNTFQKLYRSAKHTLLHKETV